MATNFTFGQEISRALRNTLDRNQQNQQFFQQLSRQLEQDAFNRQVRTLAQKMQQKRIDLERDRFEENLIAEGLDRARQEEQDKLAKRVKEKQIENLASLIENRGNDSNGRTTAPETIISTNLSLKNSLDRDRRSVEEEIDQLEDEFRQFSQEFDEDGNVIEKPLKEVLFDPEAATTFRKLEEKQERLDKINKNIQQRQFIIDFYSGISGIDPNSLSSSPKSGQGSPQEETPSQASADQNTQQSRTIKSSVFQ